MRGFFPQGSVLRAVQIFVPIVLAFNAFPAAVVGSVSLTRNRRGIWERFFMAIRELAYAAQQNLQVITKDSFKRAHVYELLTASFGSILTPRSALIPYSRISAPTTTGCQRKAG